VASAMHSNVCFSNRPFGVKHFQTIHHCGVECRARARASLRNRHQGPSIMGFEDEAAQSLPRPFHQTNGRSKRTYELTSSIVPRGTSFHRWVDLGFPPIALILCAPHAATVSLVQRNSVPSTQMRCVITANRRARATIAFFIACSHRKRDRGAVASTHQMHAVRLAMERNPCRRLIERRVPTNGRDSFIDAQTKASAPPAAFF